MIIAASVIGVLFAVEARAQPYEHLVRNPDQYRNRVMNFKGKVIQAVQDGMRYVLRVNVDQGRHDIWRNTVWVDYEATSPQPRIVEGDVIGVRGRFIGIKSYTAVMGQTVQIPHFVGCDIYDPNSGVRTVPRSC